MDLTVIGLGKLGLPLACLQAQRHRVYGVDLSEHTVWSVNRGVSPIVEPFLDDMLKEVTASGQLTAHTDFSSVANTELTLIIVPTPSNSKGAFDSGYVLGALAEAAPHMREGHVVVVCSTVMPGTCAGNITKVLEQHSGLKVGETIGLVYSPEFIALGSVIYDMKNPAMTIIGESDARAGSLYATLVPKNVPVRFMSLTSAEIAKISLNAYVTMKISFANVLGELCEHYEDADSEEITRAIGLDPRVGKPYIRPGGPYGGPCFPRDNRAFALVGENVGVSMPLAKATDEINDRQIDRMVRLIGSHPQRTVGILGLSYKPGTPIAEESFGVKLAERLFGLGYQVHVYDRNVDRDAKILSKGISWEMTLDQCVGDDIVTVVALPDPELISHFPKVFAGDGKHQSLIVDCWNCLPDGPWDETNVIRMGRA